MSELTDIHANTYCCCIQPSVMGWEDLKLLLPKARAKGIRIWGSLIPPSESTIPLDYEKSALDFARLSLEHSNLVAWSIDDFTHNLRFYTPAKVKGMLDGARRINPNLAFAPCCYYKAITPAFVTNYGPLLDGVLFPYRHESGVANLTDPSQVEGEVKRIKELTGADCPIIVDVYASSHGTLGATTPEYVEQVMAAAHGCADGVMIYCHQDPDTDKYQLVKRLFGAWGEGPD